MASKSLGTLTLDLVARVGGFEAGMDKAERRARRSAKEMEGAAEQAGKAWKALGGIVGAIGAGSAISRALDNTKQFELQQVQLAAVLRSTGEAAGYTQEQLNAMGAAMSGSSMFSTGDIAEAQTTLLAFTGIVGDQFPAALQAAADMAARTGMSVKSAAETIGRALDVPSKGLGSLSDQGFRFTDEQKKLAAQLEKTGRTAEAQAIILSALEESYGGAAKAARDTFAGALSALQGTIDNLMTGGEGTLSAATAAVNGLNDALSSPEAAQAVELLTDAAMVLAAVLAGRLVGSAAASAVAFAQAQIQAVRYQATLASMAGVSKAAAVGIGAAATAARAASAAFALIGGPAGAVALATIAIGAYALRGDEAKSATIDLTKAVRDLSAAQREVEAIDVARKVDELSADAAVLAKNLAYAEENSKGAGRRSQRFAEDVARIRLEAEKTGQELAKYQKRLDELRNFKPKAAPADAGDDERIIDFDAIERQVAALELAAITAGMAADEAVLYKLAQEGATEADILRADAALKVAGAVKEQSKAIEEQQEKNRAALAVIEGLQTEEERIRASYDKRRQIILDSTIHTAEEKREALLRLEEETNKARLGSSDDFWERWLAGAEESLTNFNEMAASVVENFSSQFGNAFESVILDAESAGDAFDQLAEAMIRSVVNATGQMLAQWAAYEIAKMLLAKPAQAGAVVTMTANAQAASLMAGINAFASTAAIPIVGPPAAPGAMAAALAATSPMVAAVSAAASAGLAGMAHEGIDKIPATGTWLLEKGERVTTANTSAKLDATLDRIQAGMANGQSAPTINVIEDASRAGRRDTREVDGRQIIDIFVANIRKYGAARKVLKQALGLRDAPK